MSGKSLLRSIMTRLALSLFIAFLACLPLFNGTIVMGSDTAFHLNRIEALYEAAKNGIFLPGVFWNQNQGYGYGSPLFYSVFFLYIPVLFRFLGMGMIPAYRLFLYVVFTAMAYTSMGLVERAVSRKPLYLFMGGMLYVFCSYCYFNLYLRGAVGEALAYIFVPVVFQAAYELFYEEKPAAVRLALGFGCLLLSHNITFFLMFLLFGIITAAHLGTMIRNRQILFHILLAGLIGFLLTMWFSLPMLEQLNSGLYRISSYFNRAAEMAQSAVKPYHLLAVLPLKAERLKNNVGLVLLLFPAGVFSERSRSRRHRFAKECALIGYVLLLMTTTLFPWKAADFFSFMQFPHRLFTVCACPLMLAGMYTISRYRLSRLRKKIQPVLMCGIILLTGFHMILLEYFKPGNFVTETRPEEILELANFTNVEKDSWYNIMELSTPDYLPIDKNINYRTVMRIAVHDSVIDSRFEEVNQTIRWYYSGGGTYVFPKTWYAGYEAVVHVPGSSDIRCVTQCEEEMGLVQAEIPPDLPEDSIVELRFRGTKLRRNLFLLMPFVLITATAVLLILPGISKGRISAGKPKN